jgi:hypothetical protein
LFDRLTAALYSIKEQSSARRTAEKGGYRDGQEREPGLTDGTVLLSVAMKNEVFIVEDTGSILALMAERTVRALSWHTQNFFLTGYFAFKSVIQLL